MVANPILGVSRVLRWCFAVAALACATTGHAMERVGINGAVCAFDNIADAVAAADDGDQIMVQVGYYVEQPGSVGKSLSFVSATEDCTADDDGVVIIDGVGLPGRLFRFDSFGQAPNTVSFDQFNLTQGASTAIGGLFIVEYANVSFTNSTFSLGSSEARGGCAAVSGGSLTLQNTWVTNCEADLGGGAIWVEDGTLSIAESRLDNSEVNAWSANGGAIAGLNAVVSLVDTIIEDNDAELQGGGLWLTGNDSDLSIVGGVISNNRVIYSAAVAATLGVDDGTTHGVAASDVDGGAIFAEGTFPVVIDGAQVTGNITPAEDGARGTAISLREGIQASFEECQIDNNDASRSGALSLRGEQTTSTTATIRDCDFLSNARAIQVYRSRLTVEDSFFFENNANGNGGAIQATDSLVEIRRTNFEDNETTASGGAVYFRGGIIVSDLTVEDSFFAGNGAGASGGAIGVAGNVLITGDPGDFVSNRILIQDTRLMNNQAAERGGAVHTFRYVDLTIEGGTISGNEITAGDINDGGGGVFADFHGRVQLEDVDFEFNSGGGLGGAVAVRDDSTLTIAGGVYRENSATTGGVIYAIESVINIADANILENAAMGLLGNGGGLYVRDSQLFVRDSVVRSNTARRGAGVFLFNAEGTIENSRLTTNVAALDGGAAVVLASTLTMRSNFAGANACDPFQFSANTYCSEMRGNSAGGDGGALVLQSSTTTPSTVRLETTALIDNLSENDSGVIDVGDGANDGDNRLDMTNVLITGTGGGAAGVLIGDRTQVNLQSTTMAGNAAEALIAQGSQSTITIRNSVLWDNAAASFVSADSTDTTVDCSVSEAAQPGSWSLGAAADPLFVADPVRGDFRLDPNTSPLIGSCDNGPVYDLDGGRRTGFGGWEPGAFEIDADLSDDLIFADGFEN